MYGTSPLGELCKVQIGRTPRRNDASYWNGKNPWASIRDLSNSVVVDTRERITDLAVSSVMPPATKKGTVLVSFKLSIGRVAVAGVDLHHNEAIASLPISRPDLLDPDYLCHVLPRVMAREQTNIAVLGAVLNKAKLQGLPIPLPPLDEQRRIVGLLDRAAEIRRRVEAARATARAIIPALFVDMFGDPHDNWPTVSLESVLAPRRNSIRTGPFGSQLKHSEFTDTGIPVLGIDNAVENEFRWAKPRHLPSEKYQRFKRFQVYPRDVIITIMGTTGRVCVAPDDLPECMSTKHLCVLSLDTSVVDPRYLWGALLFDPAVRSRARGQGQIMDGWNMSIVRRLSLRLPPLTAQSVFSERVERIHALAHDLDAATAKAQAITAALSAEVFEGTPSAGTAPTTSEAQAVATDRTAAD